MAGWLLALSASGFWVGILVGGTPRGAAGMRVGLLLLIAGPAAIALLLGWGGRRLGHGGVRACAISLVLLSFIAMGWGWASLHRAGLARSPFAALAGREVRVWGSLASEARRAGAGWRAALRAEAFAPSSGRSRGWTASELVWLEGRGGPPLLPPEHRVLAEGVVETPGGRFGSFLAARGYVGVLSVDRIRPRGPPASPFVRAADAVRATLARSARRVLGARDGSLLMGLTIGDTSRLDGAIAEDFRATGLTHLLAVSGGNVAMFLAPVLALAMLTGLGARGRLVAGVCAVAFFLLLTRAEPSVLRASAMATLAMFAVFLGRPRASSAIIGGAVLILLGWDPTLAHAIGFQLSVGATVGIIVLAAPVAERLGFLPKPLALAAGTTLAAQIGVGPLALYHFGLVPSVALPANLLAFPAVAPAMWLGVVAAIAGIVSSPVGMVIGALARLPLLYLERLASGLARAPLPSFTSEGQNGSELLFGLALVATLAWWARSRRRLPRVALLVAGLVVPMFVWATAFRAGPPEALTLTFFDVGQGDAALVRSPAGASILIDGGPDPGVLARKLAALGISRLDLVVATHPHADHVAGLPSVLARTAVGLVIEPGCKSDSPEYADFLRAVEASGAALQHPRLGTTLRVGDVRLEVLGPARCFAGTESDENNDSLVLRLTHRDDSALFPGDAEEPAQRQVLRDAATRLAADVLKVPHHGGGTSLTRFLLAVRARVAVVSVGPNPYGHPVPQVLSELERAGTRVVRTDRLGDVRVLLDERGVVVTSSRS